MPVETVARSLSFINWVVVSSLAVGSLAAILLLTHRSESTRGYRGFTVFAAGGWAFLAWLADGALPVPSADAPIRPLPPRSMHCADSCWWRLRRLPRSGRCASRAGVMVVTSA